MFWKKKKDSKKQSKPLKDEEKKKKLFVKATDETRQAYRVSPLPSEPIRFEFDGKEITVVDISMGGVSFKNENFAKGTTQEVSFVLPGENVDISTKLAVVAILEAKNLCCCEFQDLNPDDEDAICDYVLDRQKEELKSKKHHH
ncbi:MAG: PilZ domain-containing protein [Nitrospinota bacterium]|nr:PilZ domain-containing protein [Nitrospinota bacterium]